MQTASSSSAYRADALVDDLPHADVVIANVALDVVEALLPRLDARLAITSGYLERDDLKAPGWHRLDRRDREGWAADLFERDDRTLSAHRSSRRHGDDWARARAGARAEHE